MNQNKQTPIDEESKSKRKRLQLWGYFGIALITLLVFWASDWKWGKWDMFLPALTGVTAYFFIAIPTATLPEIAMKEKKRQAAKSLRYLGIILIGVLVFWITDWNWKSPDLILPALIGAAACFSITTAISKVAKMKMEVEKKEK